MKSAIWFPTFAALILILTGCTDHPNQTSPQGPGIGPFDSAGNYREDWVNDPSKWRRPDGKQPSSNDAVPVVAKNDEPPPNANPLAPAGFSPPKSNSSSTKSGSSSSKSGSKSTSSTSKSSVASSKSKSSSTIKSKSSSTAKSDADKSDKEVVKSTPKPKTTRCTVKKGDTLSRIASRYGVTTTALRKANDLSGNTIRPGQTLIIPKH